MRLSGLGPNIKLSGPKPKEIKVETFRIDYLLRTPKVEKLSLQPISKAHVKLQSLSRSHSIFPARLAKLTPTTKPHRDILDQMRDKTQGERCRDVHNAGPDSDNERKLAHGRGDQTPPSGFRSTPLRVQVSTNQTNHVLLHLLTYKCYSPAQQPNSVDLLDRYNSARTLQTSISDDCV